MREEHRVPLGEFVPVDVDADSGIEAELDAGRDQGLDLLVDDILGGLEVGNSVTQHAASRGPCLEHGDIVAGGAHLFRDGQTGGSGAHDRDSLACFDLRGGNREAASLFAVPIAEEGLELADRDRLGVLADHARTFAERFLRAETTAELGHFRRLAEHGGGIGQLADLEEGERAGDVVVNGTGLCARRGRALDAALRLEHGGTGGVTEVHLAPVVDAIVRGLLGDVVRWNPQSLPTVYRLSGSRELRLLLAPALLLLWWFL